MRRNVDTLTEALYNFSGYFKARKRGGMIVIGSHASFAGCGRAAIYTATKGYAHNFAESMWAELKPHGVDVLSFVFAVADTATLRAVLARKNVPLESVNATPPADLAHAALNALPNGPTYVWGYAADSDDTMRGANIRRLTVEAHTNGMVAYYGEEDEA